MSSLQTPAFVAEIEETIASIFETMLGIWVTPVDQEPASEATRLAASVHFTGSWSGVVILEVSPEQACALAGRLLSMETPERVDDDVRDVIGELANIIAGNLKSAIAPGATLSIPEVVDGGFSLRICGATVSQTQVFESEGGTFSVSLIHPAANPNPGVEAWTS